MPSRRLSMRLATILEASPKKTSPWASPKPASPALSARQLSLGVNVPVDQRPPRRQRHSLAPAPVSTSFINSSFINSPFLNSPFRTNPPVVPAVVPAAPGVPRWRRRSLDFAPGRASPKRRQSLPGRARETKGIKTTIHSTYRRRSLAPGPPGPPRPNRATAAGLPSYARPTASSLRHRKAAG